MLSGPEGARTRAGGRELAGRGSSQPGQLWALGSYKIILRNSEPRHDSEGGTTVPMEMITHSTWKLVRASGSQSENVCQYQEHFLNTNTLASVENYCIFDEPRNKLVGGKR